MFLSICPLLWSRLGVPSSIQNYGLFKVASAVGKRLLNRLFRESGLILEKKLRMSLDGLFLKGSQKARVTQLFSNVDDYLFAVFRKRRFGSFLVAFAIVFQSI